MVDDDLPNDLTAADVVRYSELARSSRRERIVPIAPPPDLWADIANTLGLDAEVLDEEVVDEVPASVTALADRPARAARDHRRWWLAGGSAAAAILLAVGLLAWPRDKTSARELAEAPLVNQGLDPVGTGLTAEAFLLDRKGELAVRLEVPTLPAIAGYYEVWIIDKNVSQMYSLGAFHGNGDYPLPRGVDPAGFPVVDLSIEPTGGPPTHSGVSILRGVLDL